MIHSIQAYKHDFHCHHRYSGHAHHSLNDNKLYMLFHSNIGRIQLLLCILLLQLDHYNYVIPKFCLVLSFLCVLPCQSRLKIQKKKTTQLLELSKITLGCTGMHSLYLSFCPVCQVNYILDYCYSRTDFFLAFKLIIIT